MRSLALTVALLLIPGVASASNGPKWTTTELAQFADVVITGSVVDVSSGFDSEVGAIYTYVTLDVREVLKGNLVDARITIKQLGGEAGGYVLSVVDQPQFSLGEDVLLYLEVRPRDGTLYTSALWQGKWAIDRSASGDDVAIRRAPDAHAAIEEREPLHVARSLAAAAERIAAFDTRRAKAHIVTNPADVRSASSGFRLLGPFRFLHVPAVDIQGGGQPGLAGGGVGEVFSAMERWNSAGSPFRYARGSTNSPPRCSSQLLNNGRVTITFMDPCGEMANTGGTLAMGGSYFMANEGGTSNGQTFARAVEGFVINNDSPVALQYLTNPGCFEEVQAHELGHVLGLNHSSDPSALMYAYIDSGSCWNGTRGLRADDVAGLMFIYGGTSAPPATTPTSAPADVRVVVQPTQVQVSWTDPTSTSSSPATAYQIEFRSGHSDTGAVVASIRQANATLVVGIPAGLSGPFSVTVAGINAAGVGPRSVRQDFTIGAGATCTAAPAAPIGLTASVSDGFARVGWAPVSGATRYSVQAGSAVGLADIYPLTNVGASTSAGASVPLGFRAWVRVFAQNDCGISAPADVFLQ